MKSIWVILLLVMTGCGRDILGPKGDTGATGPQGIAGQNGQDGQPGTNGTNGTNGQPGAKGDTGNPGAGTRTTTLLTVPATPNPYPYAITGLTLADAPLVAVYLSLSTGWEPLPTGNTTFALQEGGIKLYNANTTNVKIVVVK